MMSADTTKRLHKINWIEDEEVVVPSDDEEDSVSIQVFTIHDQEEYNDSCDILGRVFHELDAIELCDRFNSHDGLIQENQRLQAIVDTQREILLVPVLAVYPDRKTMHLDEHLKEIYSRNGDSYESTIIQSAMEYIANIRKALTLTATDKEQK